MGESASTAMEEVAEPRKAGSIRADRRPIFRMVGLWLSWLHNVTCVRIRIPAGHDKQTRQHPGVPGGQ